MRLELEKKTPLDDVTEKQLNAAILSLRSYGPSSYASLTDDNGNYVQVAGGGVTCTLEKRDVTTGKHFRGYKDEKSKVFPDGTALVFGGGEIRLQADEWFNVDEVSAVFTSFLKREELPTFVRWRDMSQVFAGDVT